MPNCARGRGNETERLTLLEDHRDAVRAELAQVREHLAFIEHKIANYQEKLNDQSENTRESGAEVSRRAWGAWA